MPNIASALKAEISRLARKEIRGEVTRLQQAVTAYRGEIAALKRRVSELERDAKHSARRERAPAPDISEDGAGLRFRAEGFAQHRRRLGLSAREMGLLLGASSLSVYKWESGKAKPRPQHLQAIAAVRKMGKREAATRLAEFTSRNAKA